MINEDNQKLISPCKDFKIACEEIRKVRIVQGFRQYWIKWLQLPEQYCSWERPANLAAFGKQVERYNMIKKYEIQWMERQYCILNDRFINKYPLLPFEIGEAEDLGLRERLLKSYREFFESRQPKSQLDSVKFGQPFFECKAKNVQTTAQPKNKGHKAKSNLENISYKQFGRQLQFQENQQDTNKKTAFADFCLLEEEIDEALQKMIMKQKENEGTSLPPLGFQEVSFEIDISEYEYSNEGLKERYSNFDLLQNKVANGGLKQAGREQFKPNYLKIKEEIDHYKLFFKGKHSIYHYRSSPSDQDESSYPPKHVSSNSYELDYSSSPNPFESSQRQRFVKKKLNLSQKEQVQDFSDLVKLNSQSQEDCQFNHSAEIIQNSKQLSLINAQMQVEWRKGVLQQSYNGIQRANQSYENYPNIGKEETNKVLIHQQNSIKNDHLLQNAQLHQQLQSQSPFDLLAQNEGPFQKQEENFGNDALSQQHELQADAANSQKQPYCQNLPNEKNFQSPQIQSQFHEAQKQLQKMSEYLIQKSRENDSKNIERGQDSIEQQDKGFGQINQAEKLQACVQSFPKNKPNQKGPMFEADEILLIEAMAERQIKQEQLQEISRGQYFNESNIKKEHTANKKKLIHKQNILKTQHTITKIKSTVKIKRKLERSQLPQFLFKPTPLGNDYISVRKHIDQKTLTWTQMSSKRLPVFVKIMEQVTVDGVTFLYCLFWDQVCQLLQKCVMLAHFQEFYPSEFQSYKAGARVQAVRINIDDFE